MKFCIIGAGSTVFTKRIITDLLLMPEFQAMELSLMDIDSESGSNVSVKNKQSEI